MWTLPTYIALFACGIAAAVLAHGRRLGRGGAALLFAVGWAAVGLNGWWHSGGTGFAGHVVADLPAAAGFAAVVTAVALRPPRLLATRPLHVLGTLSYGIYLWHMPVLYALQIREVLPETALPALAAVLGPTLVLATGSWLLVERPVLRWAARATRRGRASGRADASLAARA
jgi:peptidoglycan/LPS O-acetylase OafA/YrhL